MLSYDTIFNIRLKMRSILVASVIEVNRFLKQFKALMNAQNGVEFIPRDKNLNDMITLNLLPNDVDDYINQLTYRNYSEGPDNDNDGTAGQIWVFWGEIDSNPIYIKLKLDTKAKCISFHIAERRMPQPYNI